MNSFSNKTALQQTLDYVQNFSIDLEYFRFSFYCFIFREREYFLANQLEIKWFPYLSSHIKITYYEWDDSVVHTDKHLFAGGQMKKMVSNELYPCCKLIYMIVICPD